MAVLRHAQRHRMHQPTDLHNQGTNLSLQVLVECLLIRVWLQLQPPESSKLRTVDMLAMCPAPAGGLSYSMRWSCKCHKIWSLCLVFHHSPSLLTCEVSLTRRQAPPPDTIPAAVAVCREGLRFRRSPRQITAKIPVASTRLDVT